MDRFCLSPKIEQGAANIRILHADRAVEIPGVRNAALATTWLVRRETIFEQRIIERLHLPGDDALLDVDVPTAAARAVDAMCAANHFIVLPAVAIKLFPRARLRTDQVFDPVHYFVLPTSSSLTPRSRFLQARFSSASATSIDATPITKNRGSSVVIPACGGGTGFLSLAS